MIFSLIYIPEPLSTLRLWIFFLNAFEKYLTLNMYKTSLFSFHLSFLSCKTKEKQSKMNQKPVNFSWLSMSYLHGTITSSPRAGHMRVILFSSQLLYPICLRVPPSPPLTRLSRLVPQAHSKYHHLSPTKQCLSPGLFTSSPSCLLPPHSNHSSQSHHHDVFGKHTFVFHWLWGQAYAWWGRVTRVPLTGPQVLFPVSDPPLSHAAESPPQVNM